MADPRELRTQQMLSVYAPELFGRGVPPGQATTPANNPARPSPPAGSGDSATFGPEIGRGGYNNFANPQIQQMISSLLPLLFSFMQNEPVLSNALRPQSGQVGASPSGDTYGLQLPSQWSDVPTIGGFYQPGQSYAPIPGLPADIWGRTPDLSIPIRTNPDGSPNFDDIMARNRSMLTPQEQAAGMEYYRKYYGSPTMTGNAGGSSGVSGAMGTYNGNAAPAGPFVMYPGQMVAPYAPAPKPAPAPVSQPQPVAPKSTPWNDPFYFNK